MAARQAGCPLCESAGGALVFQGDRLRVIRAAERGFPGFYRVIWNDHVAEFSSLDAGNRQHCMEAVVVVERALLAHLQPAKVNLAALGNAVPHLHWHVIARFAGDSHFPSPVWAAPLRDADPIDTEAIVRRLPAMEAAMAGELAGLR